MTKLKIATSAVVALVVSLVGAGPASAHVTASAADAAVGGYAVVTLRVPTESETAGTVGLQVSLPTDSPLASVRAETTPGWTTTLTRTALAKPVDNGHGKSIDQAVSTVNFTASPGVSIAPGEFAEFRLLVGPLLRGGALVLPTKQRYSDGTEVSWIDRSTDGTKTDHPAPQITVAPSGGEHGHDSRAALGAQPSTPLTWPAYALVLAALGASGAALVTARRNAK
ncbi:YcnI family copper-binding membrane protein [Nocardia camponoti]|uniref:YncI copper-binding domain-containing protein n=1 Tax=Nocardia camponoti TaxID=1616106 RepID=A0A917V3X6_9NOCA|nr:YcnI family protein [Nocardia camponoti]GGK34108.1 hypothetical protein GCM10011591_02270 [Nocardia camponoti]